MEKQYKAVFFDLGGTLRIAFLEEAYMRHARRKMAEIAGTDMPYEEFYQMIEERYEPYRKWALGEFKESGDEELWCKWLLPDYDPARIRQTGFLTFMCYHLRMVPIYVKTAYSDKKDRKDLTYEEKLRSHGRQHGSRVQCVRLYRGGGHLPHHPVLPHGGKGGRVVRQG